MAAACDPKDHLKVWVLWSTVLTLPFLHDWCAKLW